MVDWSLAHQIARFAAGGAPAGELAVDFVELSATAERQVAAYTGLELAYPVPGPETVSRREWAELNLDTLASMLDPVGERLQARMAGAGPLAGPLQAAAGATLAAEAGLVMGYLSHRVLGQYEVFLLQPETPPRLLFVGPNLERAVGELGVERESFLAWIALHEVTHVFEFAGVPWLREHAASLLREYLKTVEVRIERGAAGGIPNLPEPAKLVAAFREGGLAALVQTHEQREIMNRMQALMAVVEGYSEHVMDAVGVDVLPAYEGLREAMERRRRSKSAPEKILERLLGLDLKLRQYERGKRFCDAVVERHGLEALNRVWSSPEALPTLLELERPDEWVSRTSRDPAAVA
jgi:coenzyme F420 biosynthesis associated uncharacterized protein